MSENIPLTQKAAIFNKFKGPISIEEIKVPEPDFDQILVKILYSGVCHSDFHVYNGDVPLPIEFPVIGGHEGAGIVVKLGSNVKNFKLGDKVGITCMANLCQHCEFCLKGFESNCLNSKFTGVFCDGTFQQFAVVKAIVAIKIPDGIDLAEAAPVFCAGLTAYRALKEAKIHAGQSVAIIGCGGGLGILALQYAKTMGYRVFGVDSKEKREKCEELGIDHFVEISEPEEMTKKIMELSGGGVHAVINLASNVKAIEGSLTYLRTRGTAVLIAISAESFKVNIFSSIMKAIKIKTSLVGNRQDAIEALDFVAHGKVKVPVKVYKFEELPNIFKEIEEGTVVGRAVIDLWK